MHQLDLPQDQGILVKDVLETANYIYQPGHAVNLLVL